ncbi:E3 ubiquitin-protein ligase TRIM39-like [Melanotaenia boesemani]|uniref:E3 ubiquitin-protein ligase TRIM39-like n=1 Tax=Melanotaenia boesemani TaxID=1250792 RepID=UPI001C042979|nr:E3 ubiquitin-protein ligase TRIM39-like [Melanotaenia boesemani]
MASADSLQSDQFLCSICLDLFTDPVTTPCGHNFCKNCITEHWNVSGRNKCPLCNEVFYTRPQMRVNTFICEMVTQFRLESERRFSRAEPAAKPGEIPCDLCSGAQRRALKSCLVCLVSYCETHLEPHLTVSGLQRHQLVEPVKNLDARLCLLHNKPLELFCCTDQTCVCMLCSVLDHKTHEVVPLKEEFEGKKAELRKIEDELQQMIQERQRKIQEMKKSLWVSEDAADKEKAEGIQVFTSMMELIEKGLNEFLDFIEEKQRMMTQKARRLITDLEEEISELMERSSVVERLSHSEDHLQLLQNFSSLNSSLPTKVWTESSVHPASYEGSVVRAVARLEETLSEEMKKLFETELKRIQQYAVDVTLDPDTANPELNLSDDGKQVSHCEVKKNLPDNPKRFSYYASVIGNQSLSSGRFYYEVQVKGKTKWSLGVTRGSISRKGLIVPRPQNGFWTICLRNGNEYKALAAASVCLSLKSRPEKIGVFVDYEEGLVSFYDVTSAALIYSFTSLTFTEKLYPYFCPGVNDGGKNSAPLVICPVSQDKLSV